MFVWHEQASPALPSCIGPTLWAEAAFFSMKCSRQLEVACIIPLRKIYPFLSLRLYSYDPISKVLQVIHYQWQKKKSIPFYQSCTQERRWRKKTKPKLYTEQYRVPLVPRGKTELKTTASHHSARATQLSFYKNQRDRSCTKSPGPQTNQRDPFLYKWAPEYLLRCPTCDLCIHPDHQHALTDSGLGPLTEDIQNRKTQNEMQHINTENLQACWRQ